MLIVLTHNLSAQNNSLLWEINGDSLKKPSYLFGTMHVNDKRAYQFHDSLLLKLKSCTLFAGEIILDKEAAKEVSSDLMLPPGKELKQLLNEKEYKKVKKYCTKNLGIMALLINKIKPIFTSALISESILGHDMPKALDEYLQEKAKDYKLSIKGLETIKEQMAVLDELPVEEQAKMLFDQVTYIEKEKSEMQRLANIYATQNLDSIYTFIQSSDFQGEFGDAMIKNRNILMAERLEKLICSASTFCAIGAAHLPGENGVLNLLRNRGYKLRPILKMK
ncbi:MAG TPA: TraB/GumN family protein [Cytophagaceae bacterium]|nr:TraB/GumN family protein [Cytophagaceae bacterium]